MRIELNGSSIHMHSGQLVSIRDARGATLCCRAGSIWLTEQNAGRDVQLGPGACHSLTARGVAVVQALGECDVSLG